MKKLLLVLLLFVSSITPILGEDTSNNEQTDNPNDKPGESTENPINISQTNYEIELNEAFQIIYSIAVETDAQVVFASSDSKIVEVSGSGLVTAKSVGNAEITVSITIDTIKHEKKLNVRVFTNEGTVSFKYNSVRLNRGSSYELEYTISNDKISSSSIIWNSSDPAIAYVEDGSVKGLTLGRSVITATLGKNVSSIEINIIAPLEDIEFNPNSVTFAVNEVIEIPDLIRVPYDSTTTASPVYSVTNPEIVEIDGNTLKGLRMGTTEVIATIEGVSTRLNVTVTPRIDADGSQILILDGKKTNEFMIFELNSDIFDDTSKYSLTLANEGVLQAADEDLYIVVKIPKFSNNFKRINSIKIPFEDLKREEVKIKRINIVGDENKLSYSLLFNNSIKETLDVKATLSKVDSNSDLGKQVDGLSYELKLNSDKLPNLTEIVIPIETLNLQDKQIQFIYSIKDDVLDYKPQSVTTSNKELSFDVDGQHFLITSKAMSKSDDSTAILVLAIALGLVLAGAGVVYLKRMKSKQV